jgi:hypothetical protein
MASPVANGMNDGKNTTYLQGFCRGMASRVTFILFCGEWLTEWKG